MKLKVFFSWQEPTNQQGFNNRKFLEGCIGKAIKEIEGKGQLKNVYFEFQSGLDRTAGTPGVADKMLEFVDSCDIYIADITIIEPKPSKWKRFWAKVCRKELPRRQPNDNVFLELGSTRLHGLKFQDQIITLMNTVNGNPKDDPELIPFDIRHKRWPILFYLDRNTDIDSAKQQLVNTLMDALRLSVIAALKNNYRHHLPFIGWEQQSLKNEFSGYYCWNDTLRSYKHLILNNKGIIRLLGLSGLGKSHLVFESFREQEDLRLHYYYCDCNVADVNAIKDELEEFFKDYPGAYIVVDNCDKDLLEKIILLSKRNHSTNPVVTIFNTPDEPAIADVNALNMSPDKDVARMIINKIRDLKDDVKQRLIEFAGGNAMLAHLLVKGIKDGKNLGQLDDSTLVDKMLKAERNSIERKILRSLSLFKLIGVTEEVRSQLESIAKSKSITSTDIVQEEHLFNEFDRVIELYKKKDIIETAGRYVGVRPLPLAHYLAVEWADECSQERLLNVIKDITNSPDARELTKNFHEQFRYLGYNPNARFILDHLLGEKSSFNNAEVLNSELGSHLFRTFVEVNPGAVARSLYSVLGNMTNEELKGIDVGRRNLVWTIEKLCFGTETFHTGAYLMMRLAQAENESWSNNATGDFISLFPILLPATSVSLATRSEFIIEQWSDANNRPILLKAIRRALFTRDFVYSYGAEEQGGKKLQNYKPKTESEISDYLARCIELVFNEIEQYTPNKPCALEILEHTTAALCASGFAYLILPYVEKVSKLMNGDWDKMYETLALFKDRLGGSISPDLGAQYEGIISLLEKNDIVSRFRRVEKKSKSLHEGFEASVEAQQKEYKNLAEEFASDYDKGILEEFMLSENMFVSTFGKSLNEALDTFLKQTFVEDSIKILNSDIKTKPDILLGFLSVASDSEFAMYWEKIKATNRYDFVFYAFGVRSVLSDNPLFDHLINLVICGKSDVREFIKYWNYLPFKDQTEENTEKLFKRISSLPDSFATVMQMADSIYMGRGESIYPKVWNLLMEMLSKASAEDIFRDRSIVELVSKLIDVKQCSSELAAKLFDDFMIHITAPQQVYTKSYEDIDLATVLTKHYFLAIWQKMTDIIVSSESIIFYDFKNLFGTDLSRDRYAILFSDDSHYADFISLCQQHEDVAPARFMTLVPAYGEDNKLHPFVIMLLDKYGDQPEVLEELYCNIGSFGAVGSAIPYLQKEQNALKPLISHPIASVRKWAGRVINDLENQIAKEEEREIEFRAKHYS